MKEVSISENIGSLLFEAAVDAIYSRNYTLE